MIILYKYLILSCKDEGAFVLTCKNTLSLCGILTPVRTNDYPSDEVSPLPDHKRL